MDLAEIGRLREGVVDNEWLQRFKDEPDVILGGWLKTYRPTKPVILAAEGYARAGGTEILQGTDIRVAGESAVFGVTEVQRGPVPDGGLGRAAAPPDRLRGRGRDAADRRGPHRPAGPRARPGQPRGARRPGAGQGAGDRRPHRQRTARSR